MDSTSIFSRSHPQLPTLRNCPPGPNLLLLPPTLLPRLSVHASTAEKLLLFSSVDSGVESSLRIYPGLGQNTWFNCVKKRV